MRIALISLFVKLGKPRANMIAAGKLIEEAAGRGADVVCFPEMSVVGDGPPPYGKYRHLSEPIPGKYSDFFARMAEKFNVYVVVGLMERDSAGFYSSAVLIDPRQKILLKHRQVRNGGPYLCGESLVSVRTDFGRVSIAICGDVWDDWCVERLAAMSPDYIFVPMDWCGEDDELLLVNDFAPPRDLVNWKDRLNSLSAKTASRLLAINGHSAAIDSNCGACGGAFAFSKGVELHPEPPLPHGCWRQPIDAPISIFDL